MVPEDTTDAASDVKDKVPHFFGERINYASYREDVLLWQNLAGLTDIKRGPDLVGLLSGEAKTTAKTLSFTSFVQKTALKILEDMGSCEYGQDEHPSMAKWRSLVDWYVETIGSWAVSEACVIAFEVNFKSNYGIWVAMEMV